MSELAGFDERHMTEWGLIGVDEAGRGALAGPVVAAAAYFPESFYGALPGEVGQVNDSKQLKAGDRERMYGILKEWEGCGVRMAYGVASVGEIDEYNIVGATKLAMRRALEGVFKDIAEVCLPGEYSDLPLLGGGGGAKVLVDGLRLKGFPYAHEGVVKGDGKSLAIASASIVAKVERDRLLVKLGEEYPQYQLERHKGYGTKLHRESIVEYGPSPMHREMFIRNIVGV